MLCRYSNSTKPCDLEESVLFLSELVLFWRPHEAGLGASLLETKWREIMVANQKEMAYLGDLFWEDGLDASIFYTCIVWKTGT